MQPIVPFVETLSLCANVETHSGIVGNFQNQFAIAMPILHAISAFQWVCTVELLCLLDEGFYTFKIHSDRSFPQIATISSRSTIFASMSLHNIARG